MDANNRGHDGRDVGVRAGVEADALLHEPVADKLIRYAQVESTSSDEGELVPSTPSQWVIARLLAAELQTMGLTEVAISPHGIVTATLPSNLAGSTGPAAPAPADSPRPAAPGTAGDWCEPVARGEASHARIPVIGLIAHYDTVPRVPGAGVKPVVHRRYDGGPLRFPGSGQTLTPAECPLLLRAVGGDLITSDGTTLLGADDKAGVADIMAAVGYLLTHPERRHGKVRIAFTPDEETGKGVDFFDVAAFGADFAYTVDGGELGELEAENFEAENLEIGLTGRSAHTGSARGVMINALHLASTLIASIPATQRPETTDGRLGFIHPERLEGNVEQARLLVLVRDFTAEGLEAKKGYLKASLEALRQAYPGASYTLRRVGGYHNMAAKLVHQPQVVALAAQAMRELGIEVQQHAIRGGTDGSRLTFAGLLTPNLFTGGANFHSRQEWACVQWMEKAVAVLVRLVELWAGQVAAEVDLHGVGR